jgi:hypothetical protein
LVLYCPMAGLACTSLFPAKSGFQAMPLAPLQRHRYPSVGRYCTTLHHFGRPGMLVHYGHVDAEIPKVHESSTPLSFLLGSLWPQLRGGDLFLTAYPINLMR